MKQVVTTYNSLINYVLMWSGVNVTAINPLLTFSPFLKKKKKKKFYYSNRSLIRKCVLPLFSYWLSIESPIGWSASQQASVSVVIERSGRSDVSLTFRLSCSTLVQTCLKTGGVSSIWSQGDPAFSAGICWGFCWRRRTNWWRYACLTNIQTTVWRNTAQVSRADAVG